MIYLNVDIINSAVNLIIYPDEINNCILSAGNKYGNKNNIKIT